MQEIKLYFGMLKRNGNPIFSDEIEEFIEDEIKPKIDAFTIVSDCLGYWGSKKESCTILILNTLETSSTRETISNICSKYCERFDQECVLVTFIDKIETQLYGKE